MPTSSQKSLKITIRSTPGGWNAAIVRFDLKTFWLAANGQKSVDFNIKLTVCLISVQGVT